MVLGFSLNNLAEVWGIHYISQRGNQVLFNLFGTFNLQLFQNWVSCEKRFISQAHLADGQEQQHTIVSVRRQISMVDIQKVFQISADSVSFVLVTKQFRSVPSWSVRTEIIEPVV